MNDYMRALHQRFYREPDFSELEEDIENTRQEVRDCLETRKGVAISYVPHRSPYRFGNKKCGVSSADLFRSFNDTPHGLTGRAGKPVICTGPPRRQRKFCSNISTICLRWNRAWPLPATRRTLRRSTPSMTVHRRRPGTTFPHTWRLRGRSSRKNSRMRFCWGFTRKPDRGTRISSPRGTITAIWRTPAFSGEMRCSLRLSPMSRSAGLRCLIRSLKRPCGSWESGWTYPGIRPCPCSPWPRLRG